MKGLRLLDWTGENIPCTVLETISEHLPDLRLLVHIHLTRTRPLRALQTHDDTILHRLRQSANLYALEVELIYTRAADCSAFMALLKDVLLSSRALRKLRLDVHMPQGGCCIFETPTEYHGLGFTGDERLPALEELEIRDYPFGQIELPGATHQSGIESTKDYPADINEREYWADRFDWSALKRLATSNLDLAIQMTPHLTALQEVSLEVRGHLRDLEYFFYELPTTLESIAVLTHHLPDVFHVNHHGATLRKLSVRVMEAYRRPWSEGCMLPEDLRWLALECPLLQELEICLNRKDEDWPFAELDILSRLPALQKVKIWFELDEKEKKCPTPYVTFSTATMLFRYIKSRVPPLREVVVCSGAVSHPGHGLIDEEAFWGFENSTSYECKLSERDDEAAHDLTTCTTVSDEQNQWMQAQEGQPSSLPKAMQEMTFEALAQQHASPRSGWDFAFEVAWRGPLTLQDWVQLGYPTKRNV